MSLDDPAPVRPPADADEALATDGRIDVLYVDDDRDLREVVAAAVERENDRLSVSTAGSAGEGLDRLVADGVECIVSDYQMPGTDGLAFLERVRETHPDLPFILYTGKGDESIASRAISAGVTDYLRKSPGTDQFALLANRVENAVESYRSQRSVERGFRVMETAREGISILDTGGYFRYVNDAYADLVAYDRQDLLGEHWELLYPDETVESVREEILPQIPTEGRWTGETVYVRGDGEHILVDHALAYTDDGTMICLIRDLTNGTPDSGAPAGDGAREAAGRPHGTADEQRTADERGSADRPGPLVAEEAFVECVLDALEDVFYVLDVDGRIVRVNERATAVTGYSAAELTSMTAAEVVAADDRAAVEAAVTTTLEEGSSSVEAALLTSDGETVPHEFRTRRLTDGMGHVIGLVGIGRDVTDYRRREQQLSRQARQFEAFGSVLSHDLKNPLNVVQARTELLADAVESADPDAEDVVLDREAAETHVGAVQRGADRLESLITELASVMQEGDLVSDVATVGIESAATTAWTASETADATLEVTANARIRADRRALERLFDNLLGNALEHGGESVTVTVGSLPDGFYVADDGPGVPAEDRDRVFEPGFSSKDEGTGFGLSSVHQIALAHGWDVSVTDSDAGGARFEVRDVTVAE